eukprot:TRINITY_DN120_c0_g1_i1.p1 TRINITY_DN120_c0_g1~~TRINITY_DN120_c0_g1_i1.p1  ORF type:complete len:1026 (-),score=553.89 TRINITY_DN120_c0_g1_i1:182-3259(-)
MAEESIKKRIHVGGLPLDEVNLSPLVSRFAIIEGVEVEGFELMTNEENRSRGFGYLNLTGTEEAIEKCIKTFNKMKWKGNRITLQLAKPDFKSKLEAEWAQADLDKLKEQSKDELVTIEEETKDPNEPLVLNIRGKKGREKMMVCVTDDNPRLKKFKIEKPKPIEESSSESSSEDESDDEELNNFMTNANVDVNDSLDAILSGLKDDDSDDSESSDDESSNDSESESSSDDSSEEAEGTKKEESNVESSDSSDESSSDSGSDDSSSDSSDSDDSDSTSSSEDESEEEEKKTETIKVKAIIKNDDNDNDDDSSEEDLSEEEDLDIEDSGLGVLANLWKEVPKVAQKEKKPKEKKKTVEFDVAEKNKEEINDDENDNDEELAEVRMTKVYSTRKLPQMSREVLEAAGLAKDDDGYAYVPEDEEDMEIVEEEDEKTKRKREKKEAANARRLEAQKLKEKKLADEKRTLHLAAQAAKKINLAAIASESGPSTSAVIRFDDNNAESDSDNETTKKNKSSSGLLDDSSDDENSEVENAKNDWMGSDSESESSQEEIEVNPAFEGAKGKKLFEMQRDFGGDSRFKMDEDFLSDDDEEKGNENENEESDDETADEKSDDDDEEKIDATINDTEHHGQLSVLANMFPDMDEPAPLEEKGMKLTKKDKKAQKKKQTRVQMMRLDAPVRYDPTAASSKEMEVKREPKKKIKKAKKEAQAAAEAAIAAPVRKLPEVSKEKFFHINTSALMDDSDDDNDNDGGVMFGGNYSDDEGVEESKTSEPMEDGPFKVKKGGLLGKSVKSFAFGGKPTTTTTAITTEAEETKKPTGLGNLFKKQTDFRFGFSDNEDNSDNDDVEDDSFQSFGKPFQTEEDDLPYVPRRGLASLQATLAEGAKLFQMNDDDDEEEDNSKKTKKKNKKQQVKKQQSQQQQQQQQSRKRPRSEISTENDEINDSNNDEFMNAVSLDNELDGENETKKKKITIKKGSSFFNTNEKVDEDEWRQKRSELTKDFKLKHKKAKKSSKGNRNRKKSSHQKKN